MLQSDKKLIKKRIQNGYRNVTASPECKKKEAGRAPFIQDIILWLLLKYIVGPGLCLGH